MNKKQYIQPDVELIRPQYLMDVDQGVEGSAEYWGANKGTFDENDQEDDDNGFTPVATSLWD